MILNSQKHGFTLPEMMITVVIIAILLAVAVPSYRYYIRQARLYDAQQLMLKHIRHLEQHYAKHYTFKKNSTTWADLLHDSDEYGTDTQYFCIKMQGNARGVNKTDDRFTLKAVAKDKQAEPRVLLINQDMLILICESSSSHCAENGFFGGQSARIDKNCKPF